MNDALTNGHSPLPTVLPNGTLNPNGIQIDSPTTPVSNNLTASDIKIEMDFQEPESDVRHEPIPNKIDTLENASIAPQVGTPLHPSSIAVNPPHGPPPGELLEDVKMAECSPPEKLDVQMAEVGPNGRLSEQPKRSREPTPVASFPGATSSSTAVDSVGASTSYTTPNEYSTQEDEGSLPPPAKRARTFSDPDQASVIMHSATPPPASGTNSVFSNATNGTTPVPSSAPGAATLSIAQFRFCQSTVRNLKKLKDAAPFLRPVDPMALGIPHYPSVIKTPMDFSTIERKLSASNPVKPDPNSANPRYNNAEEFVSDVRLIFSNCHTFNGPDHVVTASGKRVEEIFDKQIKNMPAPLEPVVVKKDPTPPPAPVPTKKVLPARRPSTSVPTIRRSETETAVSARPKREIHPPPPKDLPYADAPKKTRKGKSIRDDGTLEQLKFCSKVLQELTRKAYWAIANPFYEPVDYVKLDLPTYPKIVKRPMDLATMRKKLDAQEYNSAQKFYDDFKLMIRNCFAFNPPGTPVNQAGVELQRLFDEKWKGLPAFHTVSDDEYDEEEDDSEDERARAIAMMESQIETMKGSIAALKKPADRKPKKEKKRERAAPVASSSKASKPPKASTGGNKRKGKKPIADDDVLTFEQKKDLSEAIQKLDGSKLEKVIQIIHEGVPEIRDSTEEIELEIDLLPAMVLTKLFNFVLRPLRAPATKRSRTGKGTGTGGLKRKSMDEDVEAEKIRQLEERMRLFEGGAPVSASGTGRGRADDSERSSDSSDASDSSGSDSE